MASGAEEVALPEVGSADPGRRGRRDLTRLGLAQAAFYRQLAQADESYTDEIEPPYPTIDVPTLGGVGSGSHLDPRSTALRLCELKPDARLHLVESAGHLIQLDRPQALPAALTS